MACFVRIEALLASLTIAFSVPVATTDPTSKASNPLAKVLTDFIVFNWTRFVAGLQTNNVKLFWHQIWFYGLTKRTMDWGFLFAPKKIERRKCSFVSLWVPNFDFDWEAIQTKTPLTSMKLKSCFEPIFPVSMSVNLSVWVTLHG